MKIGAQKWIETSFIFLSFLSIGLELEASRPSCEKSLEEVSAAIGQTHGSGFEYSTSALIPLSQLIASLKDPYLVWLHFHGQVHQKEFPTPGLAQMYRTASTAADALIEHLEERAVRPKYQPGDLFVAAAATEEMMLNPEKQPLYIRDAVLIRDGVIMVVPLLRRIEGGRRPLYMPIMAKGHQDLRPEDKLAAAFAAWALGRSLHRIPAQAKIYLKPMIDPRTPAKKNSRKQKHYEEFSINVQDHLPEVEGLHADYVELMTNPEALAAVRARRTPQLMKNPFGVYTREQLHQKSDLSMVPFPPTRDQVDILQDQGFPDLRSLSKLQINSNEFFRIAILTGLKPERLRRYVAHATAFVKDHPVILETYKDPFEGVDTIVHVDFEDLMSRDYRSGVYLFGARVEDLKSRKKDKIVDEFFEFSEKLNQTEMEEAWAGFIRFFKKNKKLKGGDYLISVYSHHEKTKFHQEFDILKSTPDKFSSSQRRSSYYYETPDGKLGMLIRNQAFFRRFKDLSPSDVFQVMERMVDLYPYVRNQFAFPTYSNGLKHILDYVIRKQKIEIDFPEGWNGLESIEWAVKAYQTGRQDLFDQIERYNRIDVDGNLVVVRFMRSHAQKASDPTFTWTDNSFAILRDVSRAASTRSQVVSLLKRHALLTRILGRRLSDLKESDVHELERVLDRAEYLEERDRILGSQTLNDEEKEQLLQRLLHRFKDERKAALLEVFHRISGKNAKNVTEEQVDSIADLFLIHRLDAYTAPTINKMIALDSLLEDADRHFVRPAADLYKKVKVPESWMEHLELIRERFKLESSTVEASDLRALWIGLYYFKAF